ncbi:MAG: hypothetical protein KDD55_06855 [Bdellovibrionales bacterium]|nr:hypothetical protein [Bdellovibrionales bacterium]
MSTSLTAAFLSRLEVVTRKTSPKDVKTKVKLLRRATSLVPRSSDALKRYHDILLYLLVYADTATVRGLATKEIKRLLAFVPQFEEELEDSGIAHTVSNICMGFTITEWLSARFTKDVEVAWGEERDDFAQSFEELFGLFMERAEECGVSDFHCTTEEWAAQSQGKHFASELAWLVSQFRHTDLPDKILENVLLQADLRYFWKLKDPLAPRTFNRIPLRKFFYRTPLIREATRVAIARRVSGTRPLPKNEAQKIIDSARSTLCVRLRETDPVTFVDPREVRLLTLERGIQVALLSMKPERRTLFESYVGYVAYKNGYPIGYGGAWIFFDRANIGVNIFDEYRGGESAHIFVQLLRAYTQVFGVRTFFVEPYQIGHGNDDGLRSGAFWFYYKLGYRPVDPALQKLAEKEITKIQASRSYRTPLKTMRKLCADAMLFCCEEGKESAAPDPRILSHAVSSAIGKKYKGDRGRARKASVAHVEKMLGVTKKSTWPLSEQNSFDDLSLLVALIPRLSRWSKSEKEKLVAVMRSKGSKSEKRYIDLLTKHARFRDALIELQGEV